MRSQPFDFKNAEGQTLSARLDLPEGGAKAFALFAHCFTCDKQTKAAVRIARSLADLGVGVLRFDFTGLGQSEGEFAATGFSANVEDLVCAARHMADHGCAPALLIGHSLGGAAVLAAAGDVPSCRAVATLAAPADPAHVLGLVKERLHELKTKGEAEVDLGGRPFRIRQSFVDDARMQQQRERIAHLGRALLVLHSPVDTVVGVENAAEIFTAAKHPKSFVSLDKAGHLLAKAEEADYAAKVIAAWASHYVAEAAQPDATVEDGVVLVDDTGAGKFQMQVRAGGARFFADEPKDVGGLASGPSPYQLVAAGLGACTAMTVRLYAEQKAWPLERVHVAVTHDKVSGATPPDRFERRIRFEGPLDVDQVRRLFEIADRCPVHRTLEGGSKVETLPLEGPVEAPKVPHADASEHFHEMEDACRD